MRAKAAVHRSRNDAIAFSTYATSPASIEFVFTSLFTWRQIQITREGQITGRYGAGVRQLAAASITERTGGIYALGRTAEVSPRDESIVVELLCAFCRERTATQEPRPKTVEQQCLSVRCRDVQIALDVLARQRLTMPVRLAGADLTGADLTGADLSGAELTGARLADIRSDPDTKWPAEHVAPPPRTAARQA